MASRQTLETLATNLIRNALQRDPSLSRDELASLVGAVIKGLPEDHTLSAFECEPVYAALRAEQRRRKLAKGLGELAASIPQDAPKPPAPPPPPARKPRKPPEPTAAQLASLSKARAEIAAFWAPHHAAIVQERTEAIAKRLAAAAKPAAPAEPRKAIVLHKSPTRVDLLFRRGSVVKTDTTIPVAGDLSVVLAK